MSARLALVVTVPGCAAGVVARIGVLAAVIAVLGCHERSADPPAGQDASPDSVSDAGEDSPGGDAATCPPTPPDYPQPCTDSACCEYGEDSCCGQTSAGMVCRCENGRWRCSPTDACLIPECPDGGLDPPPWGHCP